MLAIAAMPRYALRYAPLLILALLLIPLRVYMMGSVQQNPASPPGQDSSPFRPGSALYSVTMLSGGDAWAVGGSFTAKPGGQNATNRILFPTSAIILHYVDNVWIPSCIRGGVINHAPTQPCVLQSPLLSVSLDSPHDGWAVGWGGTFVHYDGNAWSTAPGPAHFNQNVLGVAMLSPSDGWAVGYSGSILHYDGKQWIQVQSPTRVDLHSVAMPSRLEGWAVGNSGTILHYRHGTWSLVTPSPTSNTLNSVSMLSTGEGWAVGTHGTILHDRDGSWENVHPASYYRNPSVYQSVTLFGIAMNTIRSGWIIGDQHFLIYNSEAWIEPGNSINFSPVSSEGKAPGTMVNNFNLYAIATSPSGEAWTVGGMTTYNKIDDTIAILHYRGGKWYVFPLSG